MVLIIVNADYEFVLNMEFSYFMFLYSNLYSIQKKNYAYSFRITLNN